LDKRNGANFEDPLLEVIEVTMPRRQLAPHNSMRDIVSRCDTCLGQKHEHKPSTS
jgi:hypothetical protein